MKQLLYITYLLLVTSYLIFPIKANAHKPSDSYIYLKKHDSDTSLVQAQWDVALRDLDYAIGLDDNNDGTITWGEVRKHHKDIETYLSPLFNMKTKESYCTNKTFEHLIDKHSDGTYTVLKFNLDCNEIKKRPTKFKLDYSFFFNLDPNHRGLLNIQHEGKTLTAIFSPERSSQDIDLNSLNLIYQFIEFTKEGIWHIWIGFDHILFLLALLFPAVLTKEQNNWQQVKSFKVAFWNVFKIVTAFTIAHSITLSFAALGIIQAPSRFIESAIALSVMLAALNNIFPVFKEGRWLIAFFFGLIHGFGFASVLMDLSLPQNTLLVALISFNVGVELGQLAIVSIFLPVSYKLNNTWFYKRVILLIGSTLIAIISLIWFIERAFNLSFLPR